MPTGPAMAFGEGKALSAPVMKTFDVLLLWKDETHEVLITHECLVNRHGEHIGTFMGIDAFNAIERKPDFMVFALSHIVEEFAEFVDLPIPYREYQERVAELTKRIFG
jgi:hypothetical protein